MRESGSYEVEKDKDGNVTGVKLVQRTEHPEPEQRRPEPVPVDAHNIARQREAEASSMKVPRGGAAKRGD